MGLDVKTTGFHFRAYALTLIGNQLDLCSSSRPDGEQGDDSNREIQFKAIRSSILHILNGFPKSLHPSIFDSKIIMIKDIFLTLLVMKKA